MATSSFSNAPTSGQKSRQYQSSLSHSKVAQHWKRPSAVNSTATHNTSIAASSDLKSESEATNKAKFNNPYVY